MLNVDLHCHSKVSDGVLSPRQLAERAKSNGVDIWALTDHDEVGGIAEARAAAAELGLRFVAGVEISVTWANKTIHVVGLNIDEHSPILVQGLTDTRNGREARAQEISQQLAQVGIPDAYVGAMKYVDNPDLISRTHFARYIVETGHCKSIADVFNRYLVEGKPGFVPHRWATLEQAVRWIKAANGVAVLAHPGRYDWSEMQEDEFILEFKRHGGTGIEVTTGSHTEDQYDVYARTARRHGLLASRGSDFHGPIESRFDLGTLPPLPRDLEPVWRDWH